MCGISGFLLKDNIGLEAAQNGLETMCGAMFHRGPDGEGTLVEPCAGHLVGLGMRRLAIIDTEGGQQPIYNEDRSVVVVFNGELYNFQRLRQRLIQQGHTFATHSDTEVLVHLYEEKGAALVDDLVGMFAFALLDIRKRKLLLARDRLGIKPLHVLQRGNQVLFSSELKSLLAAESLWPTGASRQIDPVSLEAMLMLMYVPGPRTIYKDIKKVPPGHLLELDLERGTHEQRCYWDLSQTRVDVPRTYDQARQQLDALLDTCVQDHLVSDVPVGAFVSGGVDSSLVASYAAKRYPGQLQTFSIGFTEEAYDETPDALAIVRKLHTPHTIQYATYEALYDLLPTIFRAMDEPFGDSSMLPTFLVSSMASSRLKVVLSGDGGDEIFAGYTKHLIEYVKGRVGTIPSPAIGGLQRLLRHLPKSRANKATELLRKAEKTARGLGADQAGSYLEMMKLADTSFVSSLLANPVGFDAVADTILSAYKRPPAGASPLQRTQYTDAIVPLADDMLVKVDRMSMLSSLEVRVPLLDHRLVEFGYHLPDEYKLQGRTGKRILKDIYCQRFGLDRYTKRKQGFGVPIETWFDTRLAPMIRHLFDPARLSQQGLFNPDTIGGDKAFTVARTAPFVFWNALMTQVWFNLQLEEDDTLLGLL